MAVARRRPHLGAGSGRGQAGVVRHDDARGPGTASSSRDRELEWSNDYGVVWHKAGWPDARLVASDPRNARIFLAVLDDGTIRASTDGGRSW